jgi:ribonuclease HI
MICVFTDASFDPQLKRGVMGYLQIDANHIEHASDKELIVHTEMIAEPTSSRMELRAVLWALESVVAKGKPIALYTDYEAVVKLMDRRKKLEEKNFKSLKTGLALANADLYLRLFELFDMTAPEIYWLKGHKPKPERGPTDHLLSLVDKKTREILRNSR